MKLFVCYKNEKREILQETIEKSNYLKSLVDFHKKDVKDIELDIEDDFPDAENVFKLFTEKNPYLLIRPSKNTLNYFGMDYKPLFTEEIKNTSNVNITNGDGGLMVLVSHGVQDAYISSGDPNMKFFPKVQPLYNNFSKVQVASLVDLQTSLYTKILPQRDADLYKPKYMRFICTLDKNFKISDYIDEFSFVSKDNELISKIDGKFLDHYNNMTSNLLIEYDEPNNLMEVTFKIPIIESTSYIFIINEKNNSSFFYLKGKRSPQESYMVFESIYLDGTERHEIAKAKQLETIYNYYLHFVLEYNNYTLDLTKLKDQKISSLFFHSKNKVIGIHLRNKITKDVYFSYDNISMTTILPFAFMNRETAKNYYYIDFSCYQANTGEYFNNFSQSSKNNNFTNLISGYYKIKKNCELVFQVEEPAFSDSNDNIIDIYIKKEYIYSNYEHY